MSCCLKLRLEDEIACVIRKPTGGKIRAVGFFSNFMSGGIL
jgi:hypothetical protein